jgi:acetyl-CoA carboxylase biotin carboxyl carrier protein
MEYKDLKKILDLMVDSELSELEIEDKGFRLCARRGGAAEPQYVVSPPPAAALAAPAASAAAPVASAAPAVGAAAPDEVGEAIVSPVVGTFYRSPTPESDAFVKAGDQVDEDTVVCIIEAMKVMNEIKAERKGIIKKVLLDNGDPVEYGQPLYSIDPN